MGYERDRLGDSTVFWEKFPVRKLARKSNGMVQEKDMKEKQLFT
jgi:hypothetical protein